MNSAQHPAPESDATSRKERFARHWRSIWLIAVLLGLGVEPGSWANAGLGIMALLTAATILNRARAALIELEQSG